MAVRVAALFLKGEALKVLGDLLPHERRYWRVVPDALLASTFDCKELSSHRWREQEKLGAYVAEI